MSEIWHPAGWKMRVRQIKMAVYTFHSRTTWRSPSRSSSLSRPLQVFWGASLLREAIFIHIWLCSFGHGCTSYRYCMGMSIGMSMSSWWCIGIGMDTEYGSLIINYGYTYRILELILGMRYWVWVSICVWDMNYDYWVRGFVIDMGRCMGIGVLYPRGLTHVPAGAQL